MYPYTDFKDTGFLYNQELNQFEVDAQKFVYEPEIWHGVINFTESQSNYADIATFIDKNHLNYIKHPQFVNSNQASIMLADSLNESKLLIDEIKHFMTFFNLLTNT